MYNSDHGESEGGKCPCDGDDGKGEEGEGEEGPQEGGSTGEEGPKEGEGVEEYCIGGIFRKNHHKLCCRLWGLQPVNNRVK